jgi:HK97 family phage prohead protease
MENKDYIKNIDGAERRYFASEVRAAKNEENTNAVIEGYAAKFNTETEIGYYYKFREKILPGAFDACLNDDVRCLFNHDPNQVLARSVNGQGTLKLSVDAVGLKYVYTTPDRTFAKDLADAIEAGDVSQSSFAFEIEEQRWIEKEGDMELREIVKFKKLYDVSPVTYPAYADTEVAKRSLEDYRKTKEIPVVEEEVLTGMSVREAQLQINKNLL